jgi:PilZ domain
MLPRRRIIMTDTPQTPLPTLAEAAALLVEASAIDVETDRGDTLELWTISSEGATVTGSAPRLLVAEEMQITCRLAHGGHPIEIKAVIDKAEYRSSSRASVVLQVVDVIAHGYRRRSERLAVTSSASLRAVICEQVVPDEVIPVTLSDLSESGCSVTMTDSRPRSGDRMVLSSRFLEGEIVVDVRVVRVQSPSPDVYTAGCYFISATADALSVLEKVLSRLAGHARPVEALGSLHLVLQKDSGEESLKQRPESADEPYWTFAKRPAARFQAARRAV